MVATGSVNAVVVLFRDRIARGVYAQLLAEEFRNNGARLVALNSRGDDSPDGELGDNIWTLSRLGSERRSPRG
jgi:predicted site-specific integrase-resolvase